MPELEISIDQSMAISNLVKGKGLESIAGIEADADVFNFDNEPVVLYFRSEKQFLLTSDKVVEQLQSIGILKQENGIVKMGTAAQPAEEV